MKNPHPANLPATRPSGFTLIELMFALAVAAVLIGIAAPNMRSFLLNNRLSSTASELLRSIQTARTEATKRQYNVVICLSKDPTTSSATCTTTNYNGWIVFEDKNNDLAVTSGEVILEVHAFDSTNNKLFADKGKLLSYAPTGFLAVNPTNNSTSMVVCDARNYYDVNGGTTGQSLARGLVITNTGRARITREVSNTTTNLGVKELLNKTGGSC